MGVRRHLAVTWHSFPVLTHTTVGALTKAFAVHRAVFDLEILAVSLGPAGDPAVIGIGVASVQALHWTFAIVDIVTGTTILLLASAQACSKEGCQSGCLDEHNRE